MNNEVEIYKNSPESFYTKDFFKRMGRVRKWQRPLGKIIGGLFNIKSVVDFGCASGYYLEGFAEAGATVKGYEYLYENSEPFMPSTVKPYIEQGNAMEDIDCGKFDLSMSIEVAEHILTEKSDTLVENLVNASNKYILMTAAPPGQGGTGHINEQPKEFWVDKIESHGFKLSPQDVNKIQASFVNVPSNSKYTRLIKRQIMFFVKE